MMMSTADRFGNNTSKSSTNSRKISRDVDSRIAYYAGHPEQIDQRLEELSREFDFERTVELQAPKLTLTSLVLAPIFGRRLLLVPFMVQGIVLMHAIRNWYPVPRLLRRAGLRTESEIARERYALKALRGDFKGVPDADKRQSVSRAITATNSQ